MELTLPPKVTDRAFARLAEIAQAMGEAKPLRVAVDGGGCSGFQYSITLDQALAAVGLGSVEVPEPTTVGLIGLGVLAMRRRRE